MRWTDESGAEYGEDPYDGVGHTYAYSHEYGGGVTTDTAPPPWDGAQPALWTHPTGQTATWYPEHGDVLTARLPVVGIPSRPVPEPDTSTSESVRPVFVDSSGRRQRRVARAARLLVIPAGGYVALLISAMLGGPTISSPFVPQADPTHSATPQATAPDSPPDAGHSPKDTGPIAEQKNSGATGRKAPSSAGRPAAPATTSQPTVAPTTTTAPASTGPAVPTATVARPPSSKGRALGSSHRPVK
ncbi:hypothetical protein ABZ845_25245 [Streptomyces sp. NPDC047022]|uniref:hypothetical protein n=1 Tax=Streptomyces sp. NPDC047022 TaxID=3155737 RepID=UPI0033E911E8